MAALAMTDRMAPANDVRFARRDLLRELRDAPSKLEAQERCAELLLSADPALDGLTILDLVRKCRGLGGVRTRALLREAQVDPSMLIGDVRVPAALRLAAVLRGEV